MDVGSGQTLASHLGGEYRNYPRRGHWMLHEEGWEDIVNEIHRWLVHSLGESILRLEPMD